MFCFNIILKSILKFYSISTIFHFSSCISQHIPQYSLWMSRTSFIFETIMYARKHSEIFIIFLNLYIFVYQHGCIVSTHNMTPYKKYGMVYNTIPNNSCYLHCSCTTEAHSINSTSSSGYRAILYPACTKVEDMHKHLDHLLSLSQLNYRLPLLHLLLWEYRQRANFYVLQ